MQTIRINTATPNPAKSSVLLIYTGGTLGMVFDKDHQHLIPFNFENILKRVPELKQVGCELTVLSFPHLIDSSNMNPTIWIEIAKMIVENYDEYDGFVILHGTDTMAYSASALSFLLENLSKPVILTGAQLPIGAIRNDARRNLLTSIQIASSKRGGQTIVPEVCIFFNDVLLRGNRAKKIESFQFNAFHSENYPSLAKVGIHIQYNHALIQPIPNEPIGLHTQMNTNVGVLKLFPGISKEVVYNMVQIPHLSGLIIETYGSGNAPTDDWFLECLEKAIQNGMVVCNITQCMGGQVVHGRYETSKGLERIGVVSGKDMTFEAAITKMMFLLGQNHSKKTLHQLLSNSIRGEMTS